MMLKESTNHTPRLSFVIIVLNGMPFIECALHAIYSSAHQIIIIEGAVPHCMFAANPDGSSIDGTVDAIKRFPDPARKICFIQGKWLEKLDMHNKALEFVTGDYIWLVDADEIYKDEDIKHIRLLLEEDPTISRIDFILDNFWKGFNFIFISDCFLEDEHHTRRIFRYHQGARFLSHRPPTLSNEGGKILSGRDTRALNIYPYHYSYVFWHQVYQKIELYHRYGWGAQWGIDLDVWYRDFFLKWCPENREALEERFPVWTGDPNSRTLRFDGEHPEAVKEMIVAFGKSSDVVTAVNEEESREVIGAAIFQKMVLAAWDLIQLDEPLQRRYSLISDNIACNAEPFWNIHVALAFLARILRPDRYLEVGVRTGGSMIQVLQNGSPRTAVAVDQWGGMYAGMPNTQAFTRKQFNNYQKKSGNRTDIHYIRGNSHQKLKRLISRNQHFDLINIDGDHSREGAWEDLEDAVCLLGDRGAIVFDDIIHPSHLNLYTLSHRFKLKYPQFSVLLNSSQDNGCALFLKNIDVEELFTQARKLATRDVLVAGESEPVHASSLTSIDRDSAFAHSISTLFDQIRPRRIIETGTFHGNGTTRIIATCLSNLKIENTRFYSIECNSNNLNAAIKNLAENGLSAQVELVFGLSVPRRLLPSPEVIREKYVYALDGNGIYVDHDAAVRTQRYFAETDFKNIPDDRLGLCLDKCDGAPDFVLLDSGGHMGNIEFNYLIEHLNAPCCIALDDINHVKHSRSYHQILKDPRFTIVVADKEKFGFCIARFVPETAGGAPSPTRLLWIRTDAIGDNILSLPALARIRDSFPSAWVSVLCQEHIAELYSACPFVDEVLTFERRRAIENSDYRTTIVSILRDLRADICINPVYSREQLADIFALGSRAPQRIAFAGNDINIRTTERLLHMCFYTGIITGTRPQNEFDLNQALLAGIGVSNVCTAPQLWLTQDDEAYAVQLFEREQLDPSRTIAFFPGAKDHHRLGRNYGSALEEYCNESGYVVVVLGVGSDRPIVRENISGRSFRNIDLTGKTTIRQSAAIIARCALAVGAETGLAHCAAAVGTPHMVLLGGGHFGRFLPYAATTTAVVLPLDCFGCNWLCRYPECHCISRVSSLAIKTALNLTIAARCDRPRMLVLGSSFMVQDPGFPHWDMEKIRELGIPVAITVLEQDGTYISIEQDPPPTTSVSTMHITENSVSDTKYDMFLTLYGLETNIHPLSFFTGACTWGTELNLSLFGVVLESLKYLRRWMHGRKN